MSGETIKVSWETQGLVLEGLCIQGRVGEPAARCGKRSMKRGVPGMSGQAGPVHLEGLSNLELSSSGSLAVGNTLKCFVLFFSLSFLQLKPQTAST